MRFIAVNGSPRKNWNTAALLDHALEGVKAGELDVQVERIDLYDYTYTGCVSCFACKRKDAPCYGTCARKDAITDVIRKLSEADGIIFGSPIYFHDITAQLRALLERLLFAYLAYEKEYRSLAPKKMPTAFIYTMNATRQGMLEMGYPQRLERMEGFVEKIFTKPEVLYSYNTLQFDDYEKYAASRFNEQEKMAYRDTHFSEDCEKAYQLGERLFRQSIGNIK